MKNYQPQPRNRLTMTSFESGAKGFVVRLNRLCLIVVLSLGSSTELWSQSCPFACAEAVNTTYPTALFTDHVMHSYDGNFYDPSYGTITRGSERRSEYENTSIKLTRGVILYVENTPTDYGFVFLPLQAATTGDVNLDWR